LYASGQFRHVVAAVGGFHADDILADLLPAVGDLFEALVEALHRVLQAAERQNLGVLEDLGVGSCAMLFAAPGSLAAGGATAAFVVDRATALAVLRSGMKPSRR